LSSLQVHPWLFGFPIGGALCSFIQLKFASREKWLITLVLTVGLWAFVYLLFEQTLHVPFPEGYLFQLLGWAE
jgi:Tripartite tricarboxylate transporter TctB family